MRLEPPENVGGDRRQHSGLRRVARAEVRLAVRPQLPLRVGEDRRFVGDRKLGGHRILVLRPVDRRQLVAVQLGEDETPEETECQGGTHAIPVTDTGKGHREVVGVGQPNEGQVVVGHLQVQRRGRRWPPTDVPEQLRALVILQIPAQPVGLARLIGQGWNRLAEHQGAGGIVEKPALIEGKVEQGQVVNAGNHPGRRIVQEVVLAGNDRMVGVELVRLRQPVVRIGVVLEGGSPPDAAAKLSRPRIEVSFHASSGLSAVSSIPSGASTRSPRCTANDVPVAPSMTPPNSP